MKQSVRFWNVMMVFVLVISLALGVPGVKTVEAVSPDIVISQVYGGGGNSGGVYTNDFVELYNQGTSPVSLAGWSIQYASATGTGNFGANNTQITPLSGIVGPGKYFLIQEAAGSAVIAPLPTPDIIDDTAINMSGTGGKVALVNTTNSLGCNGGSTPCPPAALAQIVDLVGWDGANFFEGAPAPATTSSTAILRVQNGAQDTDNNSVDFMVGAPNPRNTLLPETTPTVVSTTPTNSAVDVGIASDITITFNEAVNVSGEWFIISCGTSGTHTASVTGGPVSFTLNPDVDFTLETCTVSVLAAAVTDKDPYDPPDAMTADYSFSFDALDVCLVSYTPVYGIQGSGGAAAITGTVTTQGVVVGDYEGASPALRGFYLQDPTGDGDPATSDGIFVFESDNSNRVVPGDVVRVTGTAGENQGQSQVTSSNVVNCGTGSVDPVEVTFPVASLTFLEQYEGMLVTLPQTMYVTEHFQLGRFGQVVLSADARLQQPTSVVAPGTDANALQADNNLNKIILDDTLQNQNPDPIVFARGGQPLSASNTLRGGDTATGIVGVMTYTWAGNSASGNAFRVRPINALGGSVNFEPTNPRPTEVEDVSGTLQVGALNLLNYFNTFDGDPDRVDNCTNGVGGAATDCRGADTQSEFDRQYPKTVAAILAMDTAVTGVNEIENDGYGPDSAIQHLVDQLNAATTPGTYSFINVDANTGQINALGTDAIKVGILYQPALVTPVGVTAALNSVAFVNGGDSAPRSRPALAQTFQQNSNGARFTAVVNHLKSKGSACDDPDAGDGQGNCNIVRTNAAIEQAAWLASDPTLTGETDVLILGDLNSYAMEDPVTALKNAGFTNLLELFLGPDAYSYVFDGQWGYLDYAMASGSLVPQITAVTEFHINADEPGVLDYNTNFKSAGQVISLYAPDMFRVSDHDPVIVGLDLQNTPYPSAVGFITGSGWVPAAAGSYFYEPAWSGKAQFALDVKYKKEDLIPQGSFSLILENAGFEFYSSSVDWLWVSPNGNKAIFTGSGTANSSPDFRYIVWVQDGKKDNIRIQIWDGTQLVFDNGSLQRLSGNISIHH